MASDRGQGEGRAQSFSHGALDGDPHMHTATMRNSIGIAYTDDPLTVRNPVMHCSGDEALSFSGNKTTVLSRACCRWQGLVGKTLGKGKILFIALPLELNDTSRLGDVTPMP